MSAAAPWWELEVEVPLRNADDACAALIGDGAAGVEVVQAGIEAPVSPGRPPRRPSRADRALLIASYLDDAAPEPAGLRDRATRALLELDVPAGGVALRRRTDTEWTEQWKAFFKPRSIGPRVWIVPQWEHDAGFATPNNAIRIVLDPGMAFGTGNHATTSLCLEILQERFADSAPATLLDVGAGTGILSLAAHHLGVAEITAIDVDPDAVRACDENLIRNGICAGTIHSSATPVEELTQSYDFVVANILAHILVRIAPGVIARVKPQGTLLLSGIPSEETDGVLAAYPGFESIDRRDQGEWTALLMQRAQ